MIFQGGRTRRKHWSLGEFRKHNDKTTGLACQGNIPETFLTHSIGRFYWDLWCTGVFFYYNILSPDFSHTGAGVKWTENCECKTVFASNNLFEELGAWTMESIFSKIKIFEYLREMHHLFRHSKAKLFPRKQC